MSGASLPMVLSIADVAGALRISVRSVRRLIGQGELPVVHLTARRRGVLESDVAMYIAERRVVTQPPYTGSRVAATSSSYSRLEREYFAACARPRRESKQRK